MDIKNVLIIGSGTMGHGIAQAAAQAGFHAALYDVDEALAQQGIQRIRANLDKGIEKGKVTEAQRAEVLSRIHIADTDLAKAAEAVDLVVEAVPERLELKTDIFSTLGEAAPKQAILATNTSSLPVAKIAEASGRPDRVVGMHFFNPVHIMKLLEVVVTEATSPETLEAAKAAGEAMGKTVIVVRDSPGFATSRLGLALGLEAIRMVEEGVASPQDIDRAMELGYGHPVGPLKLTDIVGLDVRLSIAEHLAEVLDDRRFEPPALLRRLVKDGKLGRKTGEGFFGWPGKSEA